MGQVIQFPGKPRQRNIYTAIVEQINQMRAKSTPLYAEDPLADEIIKQALGEQFPESTDK